MDENERKAWEMSQEGFKIISVGELLAKKFDKDSWLIEGLIPTQSITAIAGTPGSFKTWMTLEIAKCIALGEPFLGKFKTIKGSVIFIDKENHWRHIQNRLKSLGYEGNWEVYYQNQYEQDFLIDNDENFEILLNAIEKKCPSLVIFDSLARIHVGDENEVRSMAKVINRFKQITDKGTSVLFLHHHRKERFQSKQNMNSMRGSSDIAAGIDSLLIIRKEESGNRLIIDQGKLRQAEATPSFSITYKEEVEEDKKLMKFAYEGEYDPSKTAREEAKDIILEILKGIDEKAGQEIVEILVEQDYSKNSIKEALKELESEEKIKKISRASNKQYYSITK